MNEEATLPIEFGQITQDCRGFTFKSACNSFFTHQDDYYDEIFSIMGSGLEGVTLGT
jgi:hypothetical protein